MRTGALLVVAALHGAALLALWSVQQRTATAGPRREMVVKLLPDAVPVPVPTAQPATTPVLSLPALVAIAPPSFEVQAEATPPASPVVAAAPAAAPPVPVVAQAVVPETAVAAELTQQSARRAACAPAPHPLALRERGIEGVVRLRVWVDELGRAGQVLLAASSGWRLFDDAAMAQARRCPFHPAQRGTQPVGSWVEFPVRFALETSNG